MFTPLPESRMRRRVYLVRHGQVSYFDAAGNPVSADDVPLTEEGRKQAEAAGRMLADVPFQRAIHTGLPRTRQTLAGILGERAVPIEEDTRLREIKTGDMSGFDKEQVKREFIHVMERAHEPGQRYGNGEVISEFSDRVTGAFRELLLQPGWTNLLITAHAVTNSMILAWASGGGLRAVNGLDQDPGGVNILDADVDFSSGKAELRRVFIKTMNLTPAAPHKLGLNLTTAEQIFVLRKQRMAEKNKSKKD